jgi:hypothetical protein
MAMRATTAALAAAAAAAPRGGFLRLFSTTSTSSSSFPFPQTTKQTPAREQAEPNTNLFVSGMCLFLYISTITFIPLFFSSIPIWVLLVTLLAIFTGLILSIQC